MSSASNHYKTLGVDVSADAATIKKAYRRIALLNHPDKTAHLSAVEIEARNKVFKLANTAHRILTDPTLKRDFDSTLPYSVRSPGVTPRRPPPPQQPRTTPASSSRFNEYKATTGDSAKPAQQQPHQPPPQRPFPLPTPQPAPYFRPQTPFRAPPSVPPEENPFLRGWRPPHPFSTGQQSNPLRTPAPARWFYAPIDETEKSTTISYSNQDGWDFSIGVSKKYKWTALPELPQLNSNTSSAIRIRIHMQRNATTNINSLLKDVRIKLKQSPKSRHVRLASMFIESKTSDFGLDPVGSRARR